MSEADEQRAVVEWCAWKRIPVFHIPNGGSRHKAEAARRKAKKRAAKRPVLPALFTVIVGWMFFVVGLEQLYFVGSSHVAFMGVQLPQGPLMPAAKRARPNFSPSSFFAALPSAPASSADSPAFPLPMTGSC